MKVTVLILTFSLVAICDVFGASPNRHSKKLHKQVKDTDASPCTDPPENCPPCNCTIPNPLPNQEDSWTPSTDQKGALPPRDGHHKKSHHKKFHNKKIHGIREAPPQNDIPDPGVGSDPKCPPCDCSPIDSSSPKPEQSPEPIGTLPTLQDPVRHHNRRGRHGVKHHASKRHHKE